MTNTLDHLIATKIVQKRKLVADSVQDSTPAGNTPYVPQLNDIMPSRSLDIKEKDLASNILQIQDIPTELRPLANALVKDLQRAEELTKQIKEEQAKLAELIRPQQEKLSQLQLKIQEKAQQVGQAVQELSPDEDLVISRLKDLFYVATKVKQNPRDMSDSHKLEVLADIMKNINHEFATETLATLDIANQKYRECNAVITKALRIWPIQQDRKQAILNVMAQAETQVLDLMDDLLNYVHKGLMGLNSLHHTIDTVMDQIEQSSVPTQEPNRQVHQWDSNLESKVQ